MIPTLTVFAKTETNVDEAFDNSKETAVNRTAESDDAEAIVAYGGFKLGYWKSKHLVLEGQLGWRGKKFTAENVTKKLELVNQAGTVVETLEATNTNWYTKENYNGYQVILTEKVLDQLAAGDYQLQLRVVYKEEELVSILAEEQTLLSNDNGKLAPLDYNNETDYFAFKRVAKQFLLSKQARVKEAVNPLRRYEGSESELVYDGWLNTTYDFSKGHFKNLIIKDRDKEEVYRQTALPTWDVKKQFGLTVAEPLALSGFQAKIPQVYTSLEYVPYLEIKDEVTNEIIGLYPLYESKKNFINKTRRINQNI